MCTGPDTRPRLLYLIERFQAKQVTEIKARPEFGKTSLAVAWAERLQKCGKLSPGSASMLTTMNQQAHIENLVIRVDQEPEPTGLGELTVIDSGRVCSSRYLLS
jgi:hypothetical protein